jgi:hypothetical protein
MAIGRNSLRRRPSRTATTRVREARAEYYELTGKGAGATLAGSEVGFDRSNTRYKRGYHSFECWPDTLDPRGAKGK